ncbi:MAG: hypothetical protein M3O70_06560 [Actinomycetota bacterium]|nr:hypothetical protein [Actinomycetota bacterium]
MVGPAHSQAPAQVASLELNATTPAEVLHAPIPAKVVVARDAAPGEIHGSDDVRLTVWKIPKPPSRRAVHPDCAQVERTSVSDVSGTNSGPNTQLAAKFHGNNFAAYSRTPTDDQRGFDFQLFVTEGQSDGSCQARTSEVGTG